MNIYGNELQLETLSESGKPPKSRVLDASSASSIVDALETAYRDGPGKVNARVKGCLDGNAPFDQTKLDELGLSYSSNLNFRLLEADSAFSQVPYYSVFSEVPYYCRPLMPDSDPRLRDEWESIVAEEHYRLMKAWDGFDYQMQLSIKNRVDFGFGPIYFPDDSDPRFEAARPNEVFLPQDTPIDSTKWEVAVIVRKESVTDLFNKISAPSAEEAGWSASSVKKVILEACNSWSGKESQDWEEWQTRIRHNDLYYSTALPKVRMAHVFVREFSSKISHYIVARDTVSTDIGYLYAYRERFSSWSQILHIFNAEIADGYVGGVKGICIKAFNFRDSQNKLKNGLNDAAYLSTKISVQPNSPEAEEAMDIIQMGPYTRIPSGITFAQNPIGSILDKPLMVDRQMEIDLNRNLGAYRQNLTDQRGQAVTATEAEINYSVQQTISSQQHNLFVSQLDKLYSEQIRRLCAKIRPETSDVPHTDAERMIASFQARCFERGVPLEMLHRIKSAVSYRAIGQGSKFYRNQIFEKVLSVFPMLPEDVRKKHLRNYMSSLASKEYLDAVWPESIGAETSPSDQMSKAQDENGTMMSGLIPLWTASQDNSAHLRIHLSFLMSLFTSVEQGNIDPQKFLTTAPNVMKHIEDTLRAVATDVSTPSKVKMFNDVRKREYQEFFNAFQQMQADFNRIAQNYMAAASQVQQQAQPVAPALSPELILKAKETEAKVARENQKTRIDQVKESLAVQKLAINDAKLAQQIRETNQPQQGTTNDVSPTPE